MESRAARGGCARHGARAAADDDHRGASGVQHRRLRELFEDVLAVQAVGAAGARHDADRGVAGPAGGEQAPAEFAELAPGHVEHLGVGMARAARHPLAGHRGAQADAAADAAPRQRALRIGGGGQRRGDAGNHLGLEPGRGDRLQFFLEAAEHARVAALEPHDQRVAQPVAHQQRIDHVLRRAAVKTALADVDPARPRRELAQRRIGQRVGEHDLGLRQQARAAQRDQVGGPGTGTDESDAIHGSVLTSKAPLVRWLAGSTTISAPATRFSP
jgi:hypothetical protein